VVTASLALVGQLASFRVSVRQRLAHKAFVAWAAPLGLLLASTAVGRHYVLDDYVLALIARGDQNVAGLVREPSDLFDFTTGEQALNRLLMEQGLMLPWWSDPQLKIAFYRPLSALLHRLDFALWPESPRAMYGHGLLWLGLVMVLVACLYRRLESSPLLAGVATLLFALDDSHGAVVAWISNRNASVATAFGLLALLAHHDWRATGRHGSALFASLAWLVALAAGEFAIGTLAYLVSYTVFLDRGQSWRRLGALLPYALVLAAWGVVYARSGAGVSGSGSYVSPWLDVGRFAQVAPLRAAGLLAATLGPLPSELLLLGRAEQQRSWLLCSIAVLGAALCTLWSVLRRDRIARFWLLGMLLAIVPVTASFPSDRLLLFASVGGMGLVARLIAPWFDGGARRWQGLPRAAGCLCFGAVHLLLAPLCLPLRAAQMQLLGRALERATECFEQIPDLERRTVVIVNAPLDAMASYIQAERAFRRAPRPKQLYWLTSAGSSLRITRPEPNSLVVERSAGFLSTPLERHYRDQADALRPGAEVRLGPITARVASATGEAKPRAVRFFFAEPLESASYVFLIWEHDRYQRLALERLAQPLQLPAEDLGAILARTALRTP